MIDKAMFEEWVESPVTEYVRKYLKDSIKEESELVTSAIVNGAVIPEIEQTHTGAVCTTLTSVIDISLEEIQEFYQQEES